MNYFKTLFIATLAIALPGDRAAALGFTDSFVTFYGEVRQVGGAQTSLLQSGTLEITFVNQANPLNRVVLESSLRPTGAGVVKPYSYALEVPLAYLPEAPRMGDFLAIGAQETSFRIEDITINGIPATLPDGSTEFYGLSFANRAEQYRLDLVVVGDSTDTDGDGLPDWFEELYGLDPNLADANSDFDNDGWSNLDEFRRGSNPAISNRDPQLATAEVRVPESCEAGCFLQFHDSDTAPEGLAITIDPAVTPGFELRWDGASAPVGTPITAADLAAGRLTLLHTDPGVRELSLPLSWNDGGDEITGAVFVRVSSPSTEDGNDAALWLDGDSLPEVGTPVTTWTDRSGNSRDAMQALEANQPIVAAAGSHRTIHFQNPTSHLFFQDPALPAGDHTVLVAYQSEGTPTSPQILMSSNRGFLRLDPTAEAVSYPGAPHYQIDGVAVRGFESTLHTGATSIFRREGSILQNIFGLSFNGEEVPAESLPPVLPTIGARRLALPTAEPVQDGFRGQLHELLVFPTALPEQKLRDVHDYLESKWGGAIIWDLSTNLQPVTITAAGPGRHIIRGGHGIDQLRGGTAGNVLSGGPGADILTGNTGPDHFVFGGVDTGRDILVDFDPETDVIDFSALFWGASGDARQFLSTRLDSNFEGTIPTLDTVLILQRPDTTVQEIVLRNVILGEPQLIELIVEGRIRMGALSIPTDVGLALASGSEDTSVLDENLDQSFTIQVTRTGDGLPGALDVPLGLFQDALGHELVMEGTDSHKGQRAVVSFDRGETSKQITFHPVPDLETEGVERWETAVLPHFRYEVTGGTAARSVSDKSMVTLAVLEANALVETNQPARLRVTRDGDLSSTLLVNMKLEGSITEVLRLSSKPSIVSIPAGQNSVDLTIRTLPDWDGAQPRMGVYKLIARSDYQIGNPHEATIYASATAGDADSIGFDRWVSAASAGQFNSIHDLLQTGGAGRVSDYLRAYAFGDASADTSLPGISLRIVDHRAELTTRLQSGLPDLNWQVQDSANASTWNNVGAEFSETSTTEGLRLLGPPLDAANPTKLYRLNFGLDAASGLEEGVAALSGGSQYGVRGSASWNVDPTTGHLTADGGLPGQTSRLIVEINAPTVLHFDMAVTNGDGSDALAFSINGVQVAQTNGATVTIDRTINPVGTTILMWEFTKATGTPVITNRRP